MRHPIAFALVIAGVCAAKPLAAQEVIPAGVWTNTEDAYFAEEEGRIRPEAVVLEVAADGRWRMLDAFAKPVSEWRSGVPAQLARRQGGGWHWGPSELRRSRLFSCWVSVCKHAGKPDGQEDWTFARNLALFDQGGRIRVDGKGEAPEVTIRLRNVTWAKGSRNKPSLVLYVHRDDPERAESYTWAAPDSTLIGINLRWVQASCSPADAPKEGSP